MFQNDWPDPGIHGKPLTGTYCWVDFAKSKRCDPKLSSFAETRSFGIILRCSFTWGWTIWLFGHEAVKRQGKTSLKPEILRRWMFIAVVWDPTWFQKFQFFDSPPNPHLAQRRLDDAQGELLQFRQRRVQLHAFHGCEAQVQASELDAVAYGPPSFQRILGGSQLIHGFPWGAQLGWKACSIFQSLPRLGLGWFKRFKYV